MDRRKRFPLELAVLIVLAITLAWAPALSLAGAKLFTSPISPLPYPWLPPEPTHWTDAYAGEIMCGACPMPQWVKDNMIARGCPVERSICEPINADARAGCSHYILGCADPATPEPATPLPGETPTPSPMPVLLPQSGAAPAYCFAFGFPCTDLNPGAREGCICFCDAPMWCPR
jgi:hypothetical protein